MKRIFPFLFTLIFAGNIFATDFTADFSAANKFYAQGKFSDAANAYEKILQTGAQSPALLFNAGNAEFKCGRLGKAIAAYSRAEHLAPRDSEIRANLAFVRNQVQGGTKRESFWQNWFGNFSLNEWTIFTVAAFWLTFILLAARQITAAQASRPFDGKPTRRMRVPLPRRGAVLALSLLTILFAAILGVQAANYFSEQIAVVISSSANVRSGPFDDAQNVFAVHDGTELSILDQRAGWVQVADTAGKSGWLPTKEIEILPGA